MCTPSEGLPCQITKILGTSTLAGTVVWLGKGIIPLNFQCGFLFSTLFIISVKIAWKIDPMVRAKFRAPIIYGSIFCGIAFGIPIAIVHQMTPLDLTKASYLTLVALASRKVFLIVTDLDPFL